MFLRSAPGPTRGVLVQHLCTDGKAERRTDNRQGSVVNRTVDPCDDPNEDLVTDVCKTVNRRGQQGSNIPAVLQDRVLLLAHEGRTHQRIS